MNFFKKRLTKIFQKKYSMFSEKKFSEVSFLRQDLKYFLEKNKYEKLTKIQERAFDNIEKHRNNIVFAETGSGKTFVYLLPIINELYNYYHKMEKDKNIEKKINTIIFTSSKELTSQILTDIKKLDFMRKIQVRRLGNISKMTSFFEDGKNSKNLADDKDFNEAAFNLTNYINFHKNDILITTPNQFQTSFEYNLVKNFDPQNIVFDEADNLFLNHRKPMEFIFKKLFDLKENKKNTFLDEKIKVN